MARNTELKGHKSKVGRRMYVGETEGGVMDGEEVEAEYRGI